MRSYGYWSSWRKTITDKPDPWSSASSDKRTSCLIHTRTMSMPIDDSLLRRLRKQASPAPALDHPSPAAGQLWRAYWRTSNQETACLVLVVKDAPIGVRNVDVVPVSEASVGDDSAVAIETDHRFKASAWTGIGRRIYKFTLDLRVGDLTAASADRLRA